MKKKRILEAFWEKWEGDFGAGGREFGKHGKTEKWRNEFDGGGLYLLC